MKQKNIFVLLGIILSIGLLGLIPSDAKDVEYNLNIAMEEVNITGKPVMGMTVNGGIPAPTIELTEGDTAIVHVKNSMDVETSIHWHGILLPNEEDGVSYLTTPPIKPHSTHTFSFPVIQSGTYWYHSHTGLQEQRGLYGSIVIHAKEKEAYPEKSAVEYQEQQSQKDQSNLSENQMQHHDHGHHAQTDHTQGSAQYDSEAVLVLSDWTNENPKEVLKALKRGLEWYGVKKKTKQSVIGAFKKGAGWESFKRSFKRMPPMDLSDVAYDAFLINGKQSSFSDAKAGETVRLRIINGSASTYFYVNFAGGDMTIIAADGLPVKPVKQDRFLIAIAETYDVLIKVPETGQAEFRATSQDGSGMASYWLGNGEVVNAPDIPKPNMYIMQMDPNAMAMGKMKHEGHINPMGLMGILGIDMMSHDMNSHAGMEHNTHNMHTTPAPKAEVMSHQNHSHGHHTEEKQPHSQPEISKHNQMMEEVSLKSSNVPSIKERPFAPYDKLQAIEITSLPDGRPLKEYNFHLTGDMTRYVWTMNGRTLKESDYVKIRRGENVRFTLVNDTMMHHPMHLHGHFFRVVNNQGQYSPLKHTVDVPPMGKRVIEFEADEEKDWFFHCHVLYHMKSGMARIVSYEDAPPDEKILDIRPQLIHDPYYTWGEVTPMSHMMEGELNASNTRNTFRAFWEYDWRTEFDTELTYERYLNRFTQVFVGTNLYREQGEAFEAKGVAGIRYLLPFMINSTAWVDHDGDIRVSAEKEISITKRLTAFGEIEYDTASQFEWVAGARYMLNKRFSIVGQYHSDFGAGGGISYRF